MSSATPDESYRNLSPNPYVFLVGCPGSGLTLLQQILAAHPQLAVAPEINWITDYYKTRTGLTLEGPVTPELVSKWLERKLFDGFTISRKQLNQLVPCGQSLSYRRFVTALFDLHGEEKGKRLVGSKTPAYVRRLPAMHALWPQAKFVHLIRDGRNVRLSIMSSQDVDQKVGRSAAWAEDALLTTALWWERNVRPGREAGKSLGPELYYELGYESLVARPAEECDKLCAFLGLPYDDAMLRAHEGQIQEDVRSNGLRDWRTQMPASDVERFEAEVGDFLDELGYGRAVPSPSKNAREQAARIRNLFVQEVAPRKSPSQAPAGQHRQDIEINPFVFIVGCERSGTTLLQRIVNAHPQIAIAAESRWIPSYFEARIGLTPEGLVTPELIPRLFEHYRFYKLKIGREELEKLLGSGEPVSYAKFVSGIFDLYGENRGKSLVGDKTPRYVRKLRTLHNLWPKAKFVHLIRDGRDVCLSILNWKRKAARLASDFTTWSSDPLATAAALWEWQVRLGREAGNCLGSQLYYELRYESLVTRPSEECAKLCAFLDVPYHEAMLHFHEGRTRSDLDLDAKNAWRPITAGLRDWRTQMPTTDLARFEAMAGDLVGELGYPRGPRPSVEICQEVSKIRDIFSQDVRSQGELIPQR